MNDPTVKLYAELLGNVNLNDFVRPNMVYDSVLNQSVLDTLLIVAPSSKVVQPGQRIISRGDIVDADTYQVLESYRQEYEERHDMGESGLSLLGKILYVLIFILLFTVYLGIYRKDYFEKLRSACMLYALIAMFLLVTSPMVSHSLLHVYLIPFAIVPVFVRVFMDSRTAFMAHVTVVLIAASMLQHPLEFIAVELVSGIAVVFALRELSSRSQLFWTAVLFVVTAAATNFSLHLITHGDLSQMDSSEYIFLLISGIILFCSYPLLYVIEKAFGFVSDITLVEL
jgi:membrane-associated HD superfamily phosphohydrolase